MAEDSGNGAILFIRVFARGLFILAEEEVIPIPSAAIFPGCRVGGGLMDPRGVMAESIMVCQLFPPLVDIQVKPKQKRKVNRTKEGG